MTFFISTIIFFKYFYTQSISVENNLMVYEDNLISSQSFFFFLCHTYIFTNHDCLNIQCIRIDASRSLHF